MSLAAFLAILGVHLLAAISPGPAFLVSVRTAAAEGFRPAALVALGFGVGAGTWAVAALLGLHLLFEVAPTALWVLKLGGAAFLLWIAWQTSRHAREPLPDIVAGEAPRASWSAFRLGLLTQLSNPKAVVFFGAVFVGMVPPGSTFWPLAALIVLIVVDEVLWYLFVGRVFSLAHARRAYAGLKAGVDRLFGGLMAALAVSIVASR